MSYEAVYEPSRAIDDSALRGLAQTLAGPLSAAGMMLATAESCTGGWIAKTITDLSGSSAWFGAGFVTYSNVAKQALLGVPAQTLEAHGAVSEATARAMAAGALGRSGAELAVAVTGIAGPGGGSADKPVGTVWIAWQLVGGEARARRFHFAGDREAVRRQTVAMALDGLRQALTEVSGKPDRSA